MSGPSWLPKSLKNEKMGPQDVIHFYIAFFNHFLSTFASNFKAGNHQNICFPKKKTMFFQKIVFRCWHRFLINFWPNLGPFFLQKSFKITWKRDLKKHQKIVRFLNRFGLRFGGARGCIFRPLFRSFFDGFALESGSVRFQVLNFPRNIFQKRQ